MAYRENLAAGRRDPNGKPGAFAKQGVPAAASNQALAQSDAAIVRNINVGAGKYNEGNVVAFAPNPKGTGRVGVPTAIALADKAKADNPSKV